MSTLPPMNIRYPYDPTGRDPGNLVVGEVHELPPVNNRIIVPRLGAFYAKSLIIHHNGNRLTLGKDYELAALYHDATVATGQDVNVMIYFSNLDLDGEFVLEYQVVGGQFTGVWEAVQQYVNVLLVDPRKVKWDDVLHKPELYAPMDHFHDINDIYGLNYLVPKMEEIRQAVLRIRSKEMRKVWDRIFKIKKDAEDLIARANQELLERVRNELNNQEALDRLKEQVKALDVRVSALENLDGIQDELERLRQEDAKLNTRINSANTSINNILNTELPKKVDVTTFNSELDNIKKSYLPILNAQQTNAVFTKEGFYTGYGSVTVANLEREGFNLSPSETAINRDFTILSLMNPTTAKQHTQFVSLGYTEHYIRTNDYDLNNHFPLINKYFTERLVTDKNINEVVKVSKESGNIIQMKDDGLYAVSNGLSFDTISALPEKKWSEGTSILARDKNGNFFRMGTEEELIQDLGVAITVDNAIKSFVTGSTVTYNVKITLTNSGNGLVESGDLIVTLPKQDNATPYTTTNVKHVINKAVSKKSTLELTQLTNIQPGGTCVITFDLVTSSKGSFQIGAQAVTNGQVDSNSVNNHASITLYSSETVVIDNGNIDTNYKFTANCPMIIPTVVEAPAGFESWVGKRLRMFPTIDRDGDTFTKSVSDFTDYREYVECFNHLPQGRWKIKLENCSSFTGTYLGYRYRKYDTTDPDGMVYIYGVDVLNKEDVKSLSGEQTLKDIWNNFHSWDPDNNIITFETNLTRSFLLYMRPKGSNCKWQAMGFSASGKRTLTSSNSEYIFFKIMTLKDVNNIGDLNNHLKTIFNGTYNSFNKNNLPISTRSLLTTSKNTNLLTEDGNIIEFNNPYTGNTSRIRVEVSKVKKLVVDTKGNNDILEYLKLNPIAYSNQFVFYGNTTAYSYTAPAGTTSNILQPLVGISSTYSNRITLTFIDIDPYVIYEISRVTTDFPERRGSINLKGFGTGSNISGSQCIYFQLFNTFNETDKVSYINNFDNSLTIQRG